VTPGPRAASTRCHSALAWLPSAAGGRGGEGLALGGRVQRHADAHQLAHHLGAREREFARDRDAGMVAEHVDAPQPQVIDDVGDRAGVVGDRRPRRRRVGLAVAGQIRGIYRSVGAERAQQRHEHAARAREVVQQHERRVLVETAGRGKAGAHVQLPVAAFEVRTSQIDDGAWRHKFAHGLQAYGFPPAPPSAPPAPAATKCPRRASKRHN
jgi:hypothetical protein